MPNYYLSVLYKHIIQVKNKNVGLKVGGHKHTFAPPIKKVGGHMPPLPPPPPASYASGNGVARCQKVGGAHRHVIYVPSEKNQYKRVVIGYMVIY